MALRAGSLVTVAFPFTDLTAVRRRPALVLLSHGEDLIVCAVTSNLSRRADAVALEAASMGVGRLPKPSEIRPLKLFTIHRALVHKVVGRVSRDILRQVVRLITTALESGGRSTRPRDG